MGISINTNISAMTAQRYLSASSARSASSLSKLSSGSRVPNAKDDVASLAIGNGLKANVTALRAASINAQQASSLLQVADGAFAQITDVLVRMKSLATTAMSGQLTATERGYLNTEFTELRNEVDRISDTTKFNGTKLLGGTTGLDASGGIGTDVDTTTGFVSYAFDSGLLNAAGGDVFEISYDSANNVMTVENTGTVTYQSIVVVAPTAVGTAATFNFSDIGITITVNDQFDDTANIAAAATSQVTTGVSASGAGAFSATFQIGATNTTATDQSDEITVAINVGDYNTLAGGTTGIGTAGDAATATDELDVAIGNVNTARANIGAKQNRLDFANANLATTIENTDAARSVLMDADIASEITNFTSQQVLIQAGVSMLAQANQQPSLLLRLLQ